MQDCHLLQKSPVLLLSDQLVIFALTRSGCSHRDLSWYDLHVHGPHWQAGARQPWQASGSQLSPQSSPYHLRCNWWLQCGGWQEQRKGDCLVLKDLVLSGWACHVSVTRRTSTRSEHISCIKVVHQLVKNTSHLLESSATATHDPCWCNRENGSPSRWGTIQRPSYVLGL